MHRNSSASRATLAAFRCVAALRLRSVDLVSDRYCGNLLPARARLDPLSTKQQGGCHLAQAMIRGCFRREHAPNGVAERFPDWTAVGFAIPSPFLGFAPFLAELLPRSGRLGLT
jgi:hypothetical protein